MFWVWSLLIYWVVFFVALYVVAEFAQNYFYDELTPRAGLKVAWASLVLATLLAWRHPTMIDMFTSRFGETLMLGIVGFVLFTLALRFHPPHALLLGPATVVLVAALVSLAIESFEDGGSRVRRDVPKAREPIRKSAGGSGLAPIQAEGAAAEPSKAP